MRFVSCPKQAHREPIFHVMKYSIQQRTGRKTLTMVQGIDEKYDLKKLMRVFKKVWFAKLDLIVSH
jgi:translation initiation factor 1 (eIF-1/SUI1)